MNSNTEKAKTKACSRCGEEKPLTPEYYHRNCHSKDGFLTVCKKCTNLKNRSGRVQLKRKYVSITKIEVDECLVDAKECTKCGIIKPLNDFSHSAKGLGNTQSWCRSCQSKYTKHFGVDKKSRYKKPVDFYRRQSTITKKCSVCGMEKPLTPEFFHRHTKEKSGFKSSCKECRSKKNIVWRKNHKGYCADYYRKRLAFEKETVSTLSPRQWENTLKSFDHQCAYCGSKEKLGHDHVFPVSKYGENTSKNIVPACRRCNSSKRDCLMSDWYPRQRYYSGAREMKILRYLGYKNKQQQISLF